MASLMFWAMKPGPTSITIFHRFPGQISRNTRARAGVAPGVRGDLRAHVRAVDECLREAVDGGLAEGHADHELGAGACQYAYDAQADTASAAGDDDDASAEVRFDFVIDVHSAGHNSWQR